MLRSQGDEVLDVIWVNLREEPSVYINGQPFVLRKEDDPYHNLFSTESVVTRYSVLVLIWLNRNKVENMEKRMKKDLMNELRMVENGGNIVVNDEVAVHRVKLLEKIKR
mgnify:CR=1 FL=1